MRELIPTQMAWWDAVPAAGAPIRLPLPGADCTYRPAFLGQEETDAYFAELRAAAPWRHDRRMMFGRVVDVPRLIAWYGDAPGGLPWTPALARLRARVEAATGATFAAVLLNLYRDGRDSVAWHADDEAMFGETPVIASLSLGATRRFQLRPKPGLPGEPLSLDLPGGSLLVMAGHTQRLWQHAVPKTHRPVGERLNLTFRTLVEVRR